jgi:iron complex transport system substrate-binding protein
MNEMPDRAFLKGFMHAVISSATRNLLMQRSRRISPFGRNDTSSSKGSAGIGLFVVITILMILWAGAAPCETFRDALGREVKIHVAPMRIVPLAPSLTEILYYLGLGDRVVGVTNHCNYPPEAALKPKVGSYINLNVEMIVSLAPDLVIGTVDGNEKIVVELLEQAGIPVYVVNPRDVREAVETINLLGEVCALEEKGKSLAQALSARVKHVVEKTAALKKPLVFLQIDLHPIMSVNRRTIHHDLIRLAGGKNMTAEEPITYPRISLEEIIQRKPEIILISSMERGGRFEKAREDWLKWTTIPAVKNGRVHLIDSDLIDRPSPRVVEGLENMARLIHPEIEWKKKKVGSEQ